MKTKRSFIQWWDDQSPSVRIGWPWAIFTIALGILLDGRGGW